MQFKIDKAIENEVESIILLGKQMGDLRKKYPACLQIIKKQFNLSDYPSNDFEDDIENVKVKLYAEILTQSKKNEIKKEEAIKKSLLNKVIIKT